MTSRRLLWPVSEGLPVALARPHHLGIVVADLSAAMSEMEAVVGGWYLPAMRTDGVPVRTAAGRAQVNLKVAFSLAGPMHIELLEAVAGTVWEPRDRAYLHHTGYWVAADRLASLSHSLQEAGMPREACRWADSGEPVGWAYHSWPGGGWIELVEEGRPPGLPRSG